MEQLRKEYFEGLRKNTFEQIMNERRKRILGATQMSDLRPKSNGLAQDQPKVLETFQSLIGSFNTEKPDFFPGILQKVKDTLNPFGAHLELDAFFQSGILQYVMEFFQPTYRGYAEYIVTATEITCNLCMGTRDQIDAVLSCGFLNLLGELMKHLDRKLKSDTRPVFSNVLWTLANLAGQDISYRDLCLSHEPLMDAILHYYESATQLTSQEADCFCWFVSNLSRGPPYPPSKVISRLIERAIYQLKRFDKHEDIALSVMIAIYDYLSPNQTKEQDNSPVRDIWKSNVMKVLLPHLKSNNNQLVALVVKILGHLCIQENEITDSILELDWCNEIILLSMGQVQAISYDCLWLLSNLLNGPMSNMTYMKPKLMYEAFIHNIVHESDSQKREALVCVKNWLMGAHVNKLKEIYNFEPDVTNKSKPS